VPIGSDVAGFSVSKVLAVPGWLRAGIVVVIAVDTVPSAV
jgi:hypothetical protein